MHLDVEREIVLPADREEVWSALTQPDELAQWFGADAEVDLCPGGTIVFHRDDEEVIATVEEVEPTERLAFRWHSAGRLSRVLLVLDPVPEGTRLTVTELEVADVVAAPALFVQPWAGGAGPFVGQARSLVGV